MYQTPLRSDKLKFININADFLTTDGLKICVYGGDTYSKKTWFNCLRISHTIGNIFSHFRHAVNGKASGTDTLKLGFTMNMLSTKSKCVKKCLRRRHILELSVSCHMGH